MSASFTLSPPYKCNFYTISYNPTLALQGSYTYSSTYTNSPISIHNKYISHNDTHTTTPPHNHPHPHAHTPTHPTLTPHTHLHTYTTPNTLICTPSPHKHKTLHYNIFKVSTLLQYTYRIAVSLQLLHQHMNTILNIRTLIKVPFGSYRTNHHNAIRQPLS